MKFTLYKQVAPPGLHRVLHRLLQNVSARGTARDSAYASARGTASLSILRSPFLLFFCKKSARSSAPVSASVPFSLFSAIALPFLPSASLRPFPLPLPIFFFSTGFIWYHICTKIVKKKAIRKKVAEGGTATGNIEVGSYAISMCFSSTPSVLPCSKNLSSLFCITGCALPEKSGICRDVGSSRNIGSNFFGNPYCRCSSQKPFLKLTSFLSLLASSNQGVRSFGSHIALPISVAKREGCSRKMEGDGCQRDCDVIAASSASSVEGMSCLKQKQDSQISARSIEHKERR